MTANAASRSSSLRATPRHALGGSVLTALAQLATACGPGPSSARVPQPISEAAEVEVPAAGGKVAEVGALEQRWSEDSHVTLSGLAAGKWGLPVQRVAEISDGGDDPDVDEAGYTARYNQQWSHAYLYSSAGLWVWGDAHENFYDCMTGALGGQLEGPECKDGMSARYHYAAGDQRLGDRFLGRATHYIEDASLVLHASDPALDMLTHHAAFESWVSNNWRSGHRFRDTVAADNYYYPIGDARQAVRNAAWAASYHNPASPGRTAWIEYRNAGYPTADGTGSPALVLATRQMLVRASRYATGAIKLALDSYEEWDSRY